LLSCYLVFKTYASKREIKHIQKVKALERIEKRDYSILTCLADQKTTDSLTHIALAIAKMNNAEIIFLNVMEVREGQQLMAGLDETALIKPFLDKAESKAVESGISARSIVKVSHRISQGIIDTATEESCNFIIMGRHRNLNVLDRLFSSFMDTVLYESPSEIAILHGEILYEKVRNILIPFGTDIHTRLALEVAPALSEYFNAELTIVVVFDREMQKTAQSDILNQIHDVIDKNALSASVEIVYGDNILEGILKQSQDTDLIVMGAKTGDFIELLFSRSLTREITEQVKCPVLWLKEYEEKTSFWSSLIRPRQMGGNNNE
jgi:nucleotide-binding universal stress UspA family protein